MTVAGATANGSQVRGMCGRESVANRRNYTYSYNYNYTKNKNLCNHHPSNEALRNARAACRWMDGNPLQSLRIPEPLFGKILGTPQGTRVNECPATDPNPFCERTG